MSHTKHAWLVAAIFAAAGSVLADDTQPPAPSTEQLTAWIRALDSEDYAAREEAGRNLVAAGKAAVSPVAKALLSDSPESAWRANDVLEQIGIAGDEQTLELVSQALAEASKSSHGSRFSSTSDVARRWKLLRHTRAVEQIAKLGGHVRGGIDEDGGMVFMGGMMGGGMMPAVVFDAVPDLGDIEIVEEPEAKPEVEEKPADADDEAVPVEHGAIKEGDIKPIPTPQGFIEALRKVKAEEAIEVKELRLPDPPRVIRELRGRRLLPVPVFEVPVGEPAKDEPVKPPVPAIDNGPEAVEDIVEVEAPAAPRGGGIFGKIARAFGELLPFGAPADGERPADDDLDLAPPVVVEEAVLLEGAMFVDVAMAIDFGGEFGEGEEGGMQAVQIGKEWTGGVEGFKLLRDVMQLSMLELRELDVTDAHVTQISQLAELKQLSLQRCRFDRAAVEKLKKARPDLAVLAYGEAVLGISGEPQGEGFHVSFVAPGSGANRAGIQEGDVVSRIDGEQLRDFEHLTHLIASRRIGDKLSVDLLREGKKQSVEVTLRAREDGN